MQLLMDKLICGKVWGILVDKEELLEVLETHRAYIVRRIICIMNGICKGSIVS